MRTGRTPLRFGWPIFYNVDSPISLSSFYFCDAPSPSG
ncbi:Uncharacterized protein STN4L_02253 [Streptococcus thermophilus]|nr:hypothetical protein STH8232_1811 [Streptococcus thermophilus JIM 8232]SSC64124.1 Uncharacterized protein STN4L_02253 [Streptococcus thermophilus]